MNAELFSHPHARLAEGPLWHDGRLLWVDIEGGSVHRLDPATRANETWVIGQRAGTVVPRRAGGLVVGAERGVGILDTATGRFEIVVDLAPGRTDMRCNDGKCDPRGRFFVGLIGLNKPRPPGALFRVGPDLAVERVVDGTGTANGLAWSQDERTLYFVDTPTLEVSAFDYDVSTGAISNRRTAISFAGEKGRPDGIARDDDGHLWVALYGGGAVVRCDPRTGRILERIAVAASATTACAFGGADLRDLYITTARVEGEPESGAIFHARPGATGVPAFAFAG